jgi:hypothetical protein
MGRDDDAGRVRRWLELLAGERDAAALYTRLAAAETGERRSIFEELAAVERRHAAHWEEKIRGAGAIVPPPGAPSLRTRLIGTAASRLSPSAVLPLVERRSGPTPACTTPTPTPRPAWPPTSTVTRARSPS